MRSILRAGLALALAALASAAVAAPSPPFRSPPTPGARHYRYEVLEIVNGAPQKGYRTDFDLVTNPKGGIDALILTAQESSDGKAWTPVAVADACSAAMHAPANGLAHVTLWPMSADASHGLGAAFLDTCAPPGVFFPLTDILNVVVIPISPTFGSQALRKVGDHAHYDGFVAAYDRAGEKMQETAHGGQISLVSTDHGVATLDWAPEAADLAMTEHTPDGQPINLQGTEHFAFRLELDAHTGALIRAKTTYDDLDLTMAMAGVPADKAPKVKITRAVTIEPRR